MKTETEKDVKDMISRTYAHLTAFLLGILLPNVLLLSFGFISGLKEYLTYRNPVDDKGGKLHYVDLKALSVYGVLAAVLWLFFALLVRNYVRKIKAVEKKRTAIAVSASAMLFSALTFGLLTAWCFSIKLLL